MSLITRFKSLLVSEKLPANAGKEMAWADDYGLYSANIPTYNPDRLASKKGLGIYAEMMTDEQVKSVVYFRRSAITARNFDFEYSDEAVEKLSEKDRIFRNKLFWAIINGMPGSFTDSIKGILSAKYNGFSLTEKIYDLFTYDNRKWIGIKKLALRPADTFDLYSDEHGNLIRLVQKVGSKNIELEPKKFIHYVNNPDINDLYGQSELRAAYRSWFSKDVAIKNQNIFGARLAGGFVWAELTEDYNIQPGSQEETKFQNVMSRIQTKTSIIAPRGVVLHVETPKDANFFENKIAQEDKAIAKSLLVPNLLGITEQGNTGSYSQSKTQLEAFLWTLDDDVIKIQEVLNEQLFSELGELNFGDGLYPRIVFKPLSQSARLEIASTWLTMVEGDIVENSDIDEDYTRDLIGYPAKAKKKKDDATVTKQESALNGAQVSSIVDVVTQVAQGIISRESGINILAFAFPISIEEAKLIISEDTTDVIQNPEKQNINNPDDSSGSKSTTNQIPDETIIGEQIVQISSMSRAEKRVDFAAIDRKADLITYQKTDELAGVMDSAIEQLVNGIPEEIDPKLVSKLVFPSDKLKKMQTVIKATLKDAWDVGKQQASLEIRRAERQAKKQLTKSIKMARLDEMAAKYFDAQSFTITGDLSSQATKIIQNEVLNGIRYSKSTSDIRTAIYERLASAGIISEPTAAAADVGLGFANTQHVLDTVIRTSSFMSINEARHSYYTDPALNGFVVAYEYSSVLDSRTTEICNELGGANSGKPQVHSTRWPGWDKFRPPNHYNCRSLLIPITELDDWAESPEPQVNPQEGFK